MPADNISEFNAQIALAISILYKSHPRTIDIAPADLLVPPAMQTDADYEDRMRAASGTITWLLRNNVVSGRVEAKGPLCVIFDSQLSSNALRILQTSDQNTDVQPLGQAVVESISAEGTSDARVVSELVVRRLLDG